MKNIEQICNAIGRKNLATSLGVSKSAVTNAIAAEQFPLAWYRIVKRECASRGIEYPSHLFKFIPVPSDDKNKGAAA